MRISLSIILRFILAWLAFIIVGITICSQYVIAALNAMGGDVGFALRLQITASDIIGMLPLYGTIFGVSLALAFIAASALIKYGPSIFYDQRDIVFSVAGFVAIMTALVSMKALFNLTAIAAVRSWDGFLLQCFAGALSGYIYCRLREKMIIYS